MGIEGVIRPPPEIRAVADKTASYVAKNGRAFEARILGSGKGKTPKFAFLQPTSPFHAYYEDRIRFYENGGEDKKEDEEEKVESKQEANKNESTTTSAKQEDKEDKKEAVATMKKGEESQKSSAAIDPVAKALLAQRGKIVQGRAKFNEEIGKIEPNPVIATENTDQTELQPTPKKQPQYLPPAPPSLELVHIVAPASLSIAQVETIQLVASFTALDGKGGPFFTNLSHREWSNPAFAFCQPRHGHFAYFSALVDAYRRIYDTWTAAEGSAAMASDAIQQKANNPDRCLEMAAYRVEYQRDLEEQTRKQRAENGNDMGDVLNIDWHDFVVVETIEFPADEKVELAMLPPPPPKTTSAAIAADLAAAGATADNDMEESDEEGGETIRVVPSYTPKVVSAQQSNALEEVIDPITGKSVPVKDMPEHMRIQLLDPKWAEERKKFQEKQKDSNLVSGDVVASNISRLTRDTFGKREHDLLSGETDAKKRLEEANRIIREQAQRGVGPSLPPPMQTSAPTGISPPPPPLPQPTQQSAIEAEDERAAKRRRLEGAVASQLPPPATGVPPPPPEIAAQPPTSDAALEAPMLGTAQPLTSASEKETLPAEEFVKTLSKPEVTLQIRIPNDPAQMAWNFYGQIVPLTVDVMSKVKTVKQELSRAHLNGMPANKIQLKGTSGFLKDSLSLASLNIGPTATLDMVPKTRGGRK